MLKNGWPHGAEPSVHAKSQADHRCMNNPIWEKSSSTKTCTTSNVLKNFAKRLSWATPTRTIQGREIWETAPASLKSHTINPPSHSPSFVRFPSLANWCKILKGQSLLGPQRTINKETPAVILIISGSQKQRAEVIE